MEHFEVKGWQLPTLQTAVEKALVLLKRLAEESTAFCLEAHFLDLDGPKRLAEVVPSDRFSCYCWSALDDHKELQRPEFRNVGNAQIVFENTTVRLESGYICLPPYDWDGRSPVSAMVRLVRKHLKPLKEEDREPSPALVTLCTEAAEGAIGAELQEPVKTVTEWMDEARVHNYLVLVPADKAASVACKVCARLGLKNGFGSYELLGTVAELEDIQRGGHYRFEGFPAKCQNLNAPFDTPFALARQGFLRPTLNVEAARLPDAAAVLETLGDRVAHCAVIRKYLAWKLGANEVSPRTQGNYILLSRQKVGYAMFIGFEQYADSDPSVKRFAAAATPVVEHLGATLKKVSNIR